MPSVRGLLIVETMLKKITEWGVTVFGVGHLPYAPGTFGSLVGLIIGGGLILTCPHFYVWICIGGVLGLGAFFIPRYLHDHPHKKDPSEIVIDEVLGQLLALIVCHTMFELVAAFMLFRLFDIWKPWPVSWADNLGGTHPKETTGIILDDVLAGLLAAGGLWILRSIY